ncbi:MAG: nuclear transport factor 2 family protein [Aquaticitalea sp.]
MKKSILLIAIAFTSYSFAQINDSETLKKKLEDAFSRMFENTTFTKATDYFKTDVANDYVMIGADGIVETKEELLADTERLKMLEKLTFKFFDQKTRIYDNVGILNGRSQAFLDGNSVAEFLYTAVFVKENGTLDVRELARYIVKRHASTCSYNGKELTYLLR